MPYTISVDQYFQRKFQVVLLPISQYGECPLPQYLQSNEWWASPSESFPMTPMGSARCSTRRHCQRLPFRTILPEIDSVRGSDGADYSRCTLRRMGRSVLETCVREEAHCWQCQCHQGPRGEHRSGCCYSPLVYLRHLCRRSLSSDRSREGKECTLVVGLWSMRATVKSCTAP